MIAIREITVKDIDLIKDLADKAYIRAYAEIHTLEQNQFSFAEMYSTESLLDQFQTKGTRYFVLSDNCKDAAYAAIMKTEDRKWLLDKLYVLPGNCGKGYGKNLIDHVEKIISQLEDESFSIELHVNRRNKAVNFYQHLGYNVKESWDIEIADGRWVMDGYTMTKTINKQ